MGRVYSLLIMALAVAGLSAAQAGTLYKWVDSQGRVSYHDQPPPEGSNFRVEEKSLGAGSRVVDRASLPEGIAAVVLYSTPRCASCDLARLYLDKRKVPYTEKNVENDGALQQELREKSGSVSVPTILVGEKVMNGYLESLLEGELDAAGYPKLRKAESGENEEGKENSEEDENASTPEESGYRTTRGRY